MGGHYEGARWRGDIVTERQYAMAKDLLHTVANAIRTDPQKYDIIFANKGEKIKKPLLHFLQACEFSWNGCKNVTGSSGHFSDYEVTWSFGHEWKPGIAVQSGMPLRSWSSIEIVLADAA